MKDSGLTVALLGPLEVRDGGASIEVTAGRLRSLLAALALSAGRTLPVGRLAQAMWGRHEPVHVRRSVHTNLTRLRGVLGSAAVRTMPGGYRLDIAPDSVDILRFRRLLAQAGQARDAATEHHLLRRALELWRGPPFQDIDAQEQWQAESAYLLESYLGAVERRIDLDLAHDRHGDVIAELKELAVRHPLRESLRARLLVALGRGGRRAEALADYQQLRERLADELGTEPDAQIRQIHTHLLRTDAPPRSYTPTTAGASPPTAKAFIGRIIDLSPATPAQEEPDTAIHPATVDPSVAVLVWVSA
ncbi:AfsR/SARP family transcriptional regulator [Nonomuraea endophytica]|uniref:AfsR/SARP family transcriptional regulator n=1 Tax=Nonomuraea endophytica TaxID=714136 RepID=UPI0037CBB27B